MKQVRLGDLFSIKHGFAFKSEWYASEGKHQLVTLGNFIDKGGFKNDLSKAKYYTGEFPDEYKLKEGDLIIALTQQVEGLLGSTAIIPESNKFVLNQRVGLVNCKTGVDKSFVDYLMRCGYIREQIERTAQGTKQRNTSPNKIYDVTAWVPDLPEQQLIGKLLTGIDQKIELNNKINAELEAMAKLIYDYWFVQFDFPDENGKPYKSSGGKMVYNEELKREIPEGWDVTTIGQVADVSRGDLITKNETEEGSVKVISAGIDYSYLHSTPNREKNTITISGSGANAGYVNFWREPIFACDCTTVRAKSDVETVLIRQWLYFMQDYLFSQAKGSAQPHVYPNDVKGIKYVKPNKEVVERATELLLSSNDRIALNEKENQELATLRDWLLPMLMNGQVKVGAGKELAKAAEPEVGYGDET